MSTLSVAAHNAAADAALNLIDAGSGAGRLVLVASGTDVCSITLAAPAFSSAVASGLPKSGTASSNGTVTAFALRDSSGTSVITGTAGEADAEIILSNASLKAGQTVSLSRLAVSQAFFFDDFRGSAIDASKWTVVVRISDQVNNELNCCKEENVTVSGSMLLITSEVEASNCGDSEQAPEDMDYTSGHIQQAIEPFLYGTIEARLKAPAGDGVWPCFWMLGFEWFASQPFTANIPGANHPVDGWCEIDIAEFLVGHRTQVNLKNHWQTLDGSGETDLPGDFDASADFAVYRLEWQAGLLRWSVDVEDGAGFQTLREITGSGNVPDVPMFIVINQAVGGIGGGTPDNGDFPLTMQVDWVRVTR